MKAIILSIAIAASAVFISSAQAGDSTTVLSNHCYPPDENGVSHSCLYYADGHSECY